MACATALTLAAGCGFSLKTKEAAVRKVAVPEMQCSADGLAVKPDASGSGYWDASGCEQNKRYVLRCGLFVCSAESADTYDARMAAAAAAAPPAPSYGNDVNDASNGPAGAPPSSGTNNATAPPQNTFVSVTLINECKQTVKLFFGSKPKFGSGRHSSIGSNTRTSHSGTAGDMIWIEDESGNGVSSVTLAVGMREVRINSSCMGISGS